MAVYDAIERVPQYQILEWNGTNIEEVRQFVGAEYHIGEWNDTHFFGSWGYGNINITFSLWGNSGWVIKKVSGFDESDPFHPQFRSGTTFPGDFEQI